MNLEAITPYVEYVKNTAGNATIADFDDDWEPVGPMVRPHVIPKYVREDEHGKLVLTPLGAELIGQ